MKRSECVVVERRFEGDVASFADLQLAEQKIAWCLEQHRVRPVRSYVSLDGRSMLCVYTAPDAESVRETQRTGGLSFTQTWAATILSQTATYVARPGLTTVIIERDLPEGVTVEMVVGWIESGHSCFETNGVELLASHLSSDNRRMACVFAAPDAETVRRANRQGEMPFVRAWSATHHEP